MKRTAVAAGVLPFILAVRTAAHELRPAYLELTETGPSRVTVIWKVPAAGEVPLSLEPRFPDAWKVVSASHPVEAPDARGTRAVFDSGGPLAGQTIGIDGLSSSATDALLHVRLADGTLLTQVLKPESPSWTIPVHGKASAAAYLTLGIDHILRGADHLLFVLGLLVIVGRFSASSACPFRASRWGSRSRLSSSASPSRGSGGRNSLSPW